MLEAFFYCGAVAGGAMLGLGLIACSLPEGSEQVSHVRSLSILLAAFAMGLGVIAIVVGLVATFTGETTTVDPVVAALFTLAPATVLGVPGLAMARPGERAGVRGISSILVAFSASLGGLIVLVAAMALLLLGGGGELAVGVLGLALGIVGAGAAVAVGYVGASGVRSTADANPQTLADVQALRAPTVTRVAAAEGIGILSATGALMMVFVEFE